jgi:hypothetical protein
MKSPRGRIGYPAPITAAPSQLERIATAVLIAVANNGKTHQGPTESGIDAEYEGCLDARAKYALDQAQRLIDHMRKRA